LNIGAELKHSFELNLAERDECRYIHAGIDVVSAQNDVLSRR